MPAANIAELRRRLLRWYERNQRDLPWRRTSDPYAIWISETMLQQTQVNTVIPYYERFVRAFPSIAALDRAPMAKVLALWSGLGYYRRAENLKKSARILTESYGGQLPDNYSDLRKLPGIGAYTAGALLSIAFDKPFPAVDGNARRVLERLFLPAYKKQLHDAARSLVSKTKPGQFNQSLMELGSVICTSSTPRCAACPVEALCAAQSRQRIARLLSKKRVQARAVIWPLVIVRSNGKLLLARRAQDGVLAGLWELPGGETTQPPALQDLLRDYLPEQQHDSGAHISRLGEVTHSITNRRIRAPVFLIESPSNVRLDKARWRWVAPVALERQPTSAMTRKAVKLLIEYEKRLS